jgi:hypothetical protein
MWQLIVLTFCSLIFCGRPFLSLKEALNLFLFCLAYHLSSPWTQVTRPTHSWYNSMDVNSSRYVLYGQLTLLDNM